MSRDPLIRSLELVIRRLVEEAERYEHAAEQEGTDGYTEESKRDFNIAQGFRLAADIVRGGPE